MQNIAVVTGGNSSEYVISVKSADTILANIDKTKYYPYRVEIKGNAWIVCIPEAEETVYISRDDFSFTYKEKKTTFDKVIIMIHGTPGEDGRLQGYFDMLNIPYVSSGVLASSLTFDKHFSKVFAKQLGVPTAPWLYYTSAGAVNYDDVSTHIEYPCFVKPTNAGSSFGVSKANNKKELTIAVENSFKEDSQGVIIEKMLEGRELTCGVLITAENEYVFPITEIVSKNDFFDYEAKYTNGLADEIVPANIPDQLAEIIYELSLKIYKAFNCKWFCRVDFIYAEGNAHFLEINTIPGMSAESIVPTMIKAGKFSLTSLLAEILEDK